jgi:hypothetical protein
MAEAKKGGGRFRKRSKPEVAFDVDLPLLADLESVAAMISNNVFFLQKRLKRPKAVGRWNAAALPEGAAAESILPNAEAPPARKVKNKYRTAKEIEIPPSVRSTYRQLRDTDVFTAEAPVFCADLDYQVGTLGDAWQKLIEQVTLDSMSTVDEEAVRITRSIPPSFVEHEIIQLRRGRRSKATGALMCDCSYGTQCAALSLTGNNKPLHPYLTVSQQLDWDTTGKEYAGPCLLDIRRTVTSVAILYKHDSIGVDLRNK